MFIAGLAVWVSPTIATAQGASPPLGKTPAPRAIQGSPGISGTNRAAGTCLDNTKRYVDCGNGTVTDTVTGLIWLKRADCLPESNWKAAIEATAGLILIELSTGRSPAARARAEGLAAKSPADVDALVLAARTYASLKDLPKTEELLRRAMQADAARSEPYSMLARR